MKFGRMVRNERGQMTIEMILIAVVLTGLAAGFVRVAKSERFIASLAEGPWAPLQGMIENGVWKKPATAIQLHPGNFNRHRSSIGNPVPSS